MKKILPLCADIGHGLIAVTLVSSYFTVDPTWHFLVGIVFALLPDSDAAPRLFRTGSVVPTVDDPRDHREYGHFPFLYLLFGATVFLFSTYWGFIFIVAVALHFINDSWGTGDGIMWLWPLHKRKYKWRFFDTLLWHGYAREIDYQKNDAWIEATYLQVTAIAVIEYSIFVIGVIAFFLTIFIS